MLSAFFSESSGVCNKRRFNCGRKDADLGLAELITLNPDCGSNSVCIRVAHTFSSHSQLFDSNTNENICWSSSNSFNGICNQI